MKLYFSDDLLEAVGFDEEDITRNQKIIRDMEPTEKLAYAVLVLADVLNGRLGELTFDAPDGKSPGVLEKIAMVLEEDRKSHG